MKSERVYSIINYFLYVLLLIALGVILYLLYLNWEKNQLENLAKNQSVETITRSDVAKQEESEINAIHQSQMASFSYEIPSSWSIDEKEEADFAVVRNENLQNAITIRIVKKMDSLIGLTLEQYAEIAAKNEIQGYRDLNKMEKIVTDSGLEGYKTIWNIQFLGGEQFVSNPITYFKHPLDDTKSIQISLENDKYIAEYEALLKSFQYEK
ncbi:MAG: hypothetical protein ACOZAR_02315 [Patescibacteria group bacterium]